MHTSLDIPKSQVSPDHTEIDETQSLVSGGSSVSEVGISTVLSPRSAEGVGFVGAHLTCLGREPLPSTVREVAGAVLIGSETNCAAAQNTQPSLADIISSVKPIARKFTSETPIEEQRAAHNAAKEFLTQRLTAIGARVAYLSSPSLPEALNVDSIEITELPADVFYWENTSGVAQDIQRDGNRNDDTIVIYGAASQFNGCEAAGPHTIQPGQAVRCYKGDMTQGPQAQLQFHPDQVELINCGGNIGFNGLCNILDEETKSTVEHGYFRPNDEHADSVIQALSTGAGIEYLCVANNPYNERIGGYGAKPVHMVLVSAPAFGYGGLSNQDNRRHQIEFLVALQGFRAQFQHCIDLAKREGQPVIFNAAGMGLGVFGNSAENVAKGFYVAGKEYAEQLKENNVEVRFQVFRGTGRARDMVDFLKLPEWKRESSVKTGVSSIDV